MIFFAYVFKVARDFSSEEDSTLVRMMQAVAVPVLGNVCHVFMNGLNRVQVCYATYISCLVYYILHSDM